MTALGPKTFFDCQYRIEPSAVDKFGHSIYPNASQFAQELKGPLKEALAGLSGGSPSVKLTRVVRAGAMEKDGGYVMDERRFPDEMRAEKVPAYLNLFVQVRLTYENTAPSERDAISFLREKIEPILHDEVKKALADKYTFAVKEPILSKGTSHPRVNGAEGNQLGI